MKGKKTDNVIFRNVTICSSIVTLHISDHVLQSSAFLSVYSTVSTTGWTLRSHSNLWISMLLSSCIQVSENQEPEPEMRQKLNLYIRLISCITAHFSSDSLLKVANPFWLEGNSCTGQTLFNSSYIIWLQLTSKRQTNLPAGRQTSNTKLNVCACNGSEIFFAFIYFPPHCIVLSISFFIFNNN